MVHRSRRLLRRRWWKLIGSRAFPPVHWQLADPCPLYAGLLEIKLSGPWGEECSLALERAEAVAQQRFCFLNQLEKFPHRLGWHDPGLSQLWRYHLHYFGYTQDLLIWAATGQELAAYTTFRKLVRAWIQENPACEGDGWHPYTISLRIVNWLHAAFAFKPQLRADEPFRQHFFTSLYQQARVLAADLEFDVRGNHLLENIRALFWVGLTFDGAEPQGWFRKASCLLQQELAEQVLTDGGHFERNPGYHVVVLKDCIEIALWLRRNKKPVPGWLDNSLHRMLDYLSALLPPDGHLPLLKDTAWDAIPAPHDVLAAGALYSDEPAYKRTDSFGLYPFLLFGLAGWEKFRHWGVPQAPGRCQAFPTSGYYILQDAARSEYLIFDAGRPCPDYLPAHAHADLLSYELVIDNQRIVVDSGVYEYTAGPWREYFRSTRAHNTVEVAQENQSEVWSSFRVARRAQPGAVVWRPTDAYTLLQAEHDGYQRLAVAVTHRRTVIWKKGYFWLIVDDLQGDGRTTVASHVHLHPTLTLEVKDEAHWRIQGCSSPLWLTAFGHQDSAITQGQLDARRQGWYSERFGQRQANTVLTLYQDSSLPICYGYLISRHAATAVQIIPASAELKIIVTTEQHEQVLHLSRHT